MTSKIIVNTIEADTGISSVTFASNINLQNDSSILVSSSGIRLGTGSTIAAPSANEITLSTNSAERFRITSAGNIGIGGLTNPGALLSIPAGESNTPRLAIESAVDDNDFTITQYEDGNGTYTMLGQNVKLNSSGNNAILDSGHRTAGILLDARNHGSITFLTGAANAVGENVKITSAGDVGIGTAIPISSSGYASLSLADTSGAQIEFKKFGGATHYIWSDNNLNIGADYYGSGQNLVFKVNGNVERLRIDNDGRLLLGLNSSIGGNAIFQVQGSGNKKAQFHQPDSGSCHIQFTNTQTGTSSNNGVEIGLGGEEQAQIWNYYNSYFRIGTNGSERLRITSDGETLISNNTNRFLSLDRTNASSGSGEFNLNVESNSQATVSYDDGAQIVIGTSSSPRTQAGFTERMRIDASGYVTKPNQPAFFVYRNQSVWNLAAGDTFIFNTAELNVGGHYNTSNGRFTAPITARYVFHFFSIFTGSATSDYIQMYKNGARIYGGDVHFTNAVGSQWDCVHYSRVIQLSASDYVYMRSGSAHTYHGNNWGGWSGYMLG